MADEAKTFMVEDARIIFRNFAGREGQFNRKGDANFAVVLDPDTAQLMLDDGWNVKFLEAREEGEEPTPYISVAVSFKHRPPRIVLITSGGRTQLDANSSEIVDSLDIQLVDLICRGYDWEVQDKSGTKAYLQSMFITLREDELERKYQINERPPHLSED